MESVAVSIVNRQAPDGSQKRDDQPEVAGENLPTLTCLRHQMSPNLSYTDAFSLPPPYLQPRSPARAFEATGPPPDSQGWPPTHVFDTSGQIAPPGMKPRVTATLWEEEGTLCFQVEAKGVCVARREDNHFINGTKLLNVAGMTRGRRDGILKSEKTRHVVKIGPMHLSGVW